MSKVQQQIGNTKYYEEAVPLPFYGHDWLFRSRCICDCGAKFKLERDYEHHYRKEHINDQ